MSLKYEPFSERIYISTPQPAIRIQVFTDPELSRNWKKYNLDEAKLVSIRTSLLLLLYYSPA